MVILFACFLLAASVLCLAARSSAGRSVTDGALQLAGRSVLSEYDRRLLEDYGLLAFRGDEAQIEADISYYAGATLKPHGLSYLLFRGLTEHTDTVEPEIAEVKANLKGYSLLDLNNFEAQIKDAMLTNWITDKTGWKGVDGIFDESEDSGGEGSGVSDSSETGGESRTLRSDSVLDSLPSAGYDGPLFPSISGVTDIPKAEDMLRGGVDLLMTGEYILNVFSNHLDSKDTDERFFVNEAEYVLAGKKDDAANYREVKGRLRMMRYALNVEAIVTDREKMEIIRAFVEAGTYGAIAAAVIVGVWAAAETHNDLLRIEKGEKVAVFKNSQQWALNDFGSVMESAGEGILDMVGGFTDYEYSQEPIEPANRGGWTYEGYLRMMFFMMDRETKLLRTMDIMQINLKGTYREDFLIREYYTGFRFECTVEGDKYSYVEEY
jgi:hypothetical protein